MEHVYGHHLITEHEGRQTDNSARGQRGLRHRDRGARSRAALARHSRLRVSKANLSCNRDNVKADALEILLDFAWLKCV